MAETTSESITTSPGMGIEKGTNRIIGIIPELIDSVKIPTMPISEKKIGNPPPNPRAQGRN